MKKINKTCPICDKNFEVPLCHQERYKTCGHKCGGIFRRKTIIINKCLKCNIEFVSKKHPTKPQKFCSRQCASQANAIQATSKNFKIPGKKSIKISRKCIECSKDFYITEARLEEGKNRGTYCTRECLIKNWNKKSLAAQMPGSYRQNAWKVFEKKCYDCGITDERVVVIHHIDGNRRNGLINNLIPVCHNCHCIRHINLSGNKRIPSYRGHD